MNTDAKPSSRVLAPPGGGSSNIFGASNDEAPAQKRSAAPKSQSDVLNQGPPPAPSAQPAKPNQRIAYNPITGQPYDTPKATASTEEKPEDKEEKKEESAGDTENKAPEQKAEGTNSDNFRSTRVSQPPGGRSTALW